MSNITLRHSMLLIHVYVWIVKICHGICLGHITYKDNSALYYHYKNNKQSAFFHVKLYTILAVSKFIRINILGFGLIFGFERTRAVTSSVLVGWLKNHPKIRLFCYPGICQINYMHCCTILPAVLWVCSVKICTKRLSILRCWPVIQRCQKLWAN